MKSKKTKEPSNSNLSLGVFNTLKRRIIRWEYLPGHRFTEEALCAEFGMSRSPIREALRMLVEAGLVVKEPFRSYSVKQPNINETLELYDVRLALESFIVEYLAREGMPQSDWENLNNTWHTIQNQLPDISADVAKKDEEFHEILAKATSNQTLLQILRNVDERLHFIRMTDITTADRLLSTCQQHLRVLECISAKDVVCAREAMRTNIESGRKNVEMAFKEALARAYMSERSTTRSSGSGPS